MVNASGNGSNDAPAAVLEQQGAQGQQIGIDDPLQRAGVGI